MAEKVITLPSTKHLLEPVVAALKPNLPIGKMLAFTYEDAQRIPEIIAEGIESWNLDDGIAPLPITVETLRLLPPGDVWAIGNAQYEGRADKDLDKQIIRYLASNGSQKAPWKYIAYRYRRMFSLSPAEFEDIPFDLIFQDLKFMNIETQYENNRAERS